jgi:pyridoxal phosphate enzyme (YggS family)
VSPDADVAARLAAVRERVARAAVRAHRRPEEIAVVGVSKRKPAELVAAAVRAGLRDVGENYAQEARDKLPIIRAMLEESGHNAPRWQFIGQLQRNKARAVARDFDVVQTVDRESLGAELCRRAERLGRDLDVLLQVDLCGEERKGGAPPETLPDLLAASRAWPRLRVTGLMAIPAPVDDPEANRPVFVCLRELRDALRDCPGGEHLVELSMGMSQDFEVAIEEGATIVRVGTAIFGAR